MTLVAKAQALNDLGLRHPAQMATALATVGGEEDLRRHHADIELARRGVILVEVNHHDVRPALQLQCRGFQNWLHVAAGGAG